MFQFRASVFSVTVHKQHFNKQSITRLRKYLIMRMEFVVILNAIVAE
jgi:hypothetical protein